jgi:nucleoside-diphosphate-sugar epimerase
VKKETILIAGLNNFLGFHLALKFYKKFNVIGTLSKEIAKYNDLEKFRLLFLKKKIKLIKYNVLKSNVHKIIATYKPNIWIHNISISKNWKKKKFNLKKNYKTSSKDLETIITKLKKNNCRLFMHSGSSEEYYKRNGILYEKILKPPKNYYGRMKFYLSKQIFFLCKKNKLNCAIIRLFSPYGLLDKNNKLFSIIYKNKYKNKITNLSSKRNFTYINDITLGYYKIINYLKKKNQYRVFNLANPKKISISKIIYEWNRVNSIKIKTSMKKKINDKFYYGNPSLLSNKFLKIIYTDINSSFKNMNIQKKKLFKSYYYGF